MAMHQGVKALYELLRFGMAEGLHQFAQLLSANALGPVSDIAPDDGFLMIEAHLDGDTSELPANRLVIAAPAVDGDALDAPSCLLQLMQSLTQMSYALGLDLA